MVNENGIVEAIEINTKIVNGKGVQHNGTYSNGTVNGSVSPQSMLGLCVVISISFLYLFHL